MCDIYANIYVLVYMLLGKKRPEIEARMLLLFYHCEERKVIGSYR